MPKIMKYGFEPTSASSISIPVARDTSGRVAIACTSRWLTALKLRSEAPAWAIMKSAPPPRTRSPIVTFRPDVIAPSATTVVIPMLIPSTVSSVRSRWRNRLRRTRTENDTPRGSPHLRAVRIGPNTDEPSVSSPMPPEAAGRKLGTTRR